MSALPPGLLRLPLAHRGLHDRATGRYENSLSAVRAAVKAGYGIEVDIQLSSDGEAMVFHDYALGRLTGQTGAIRQRSAAELGRLRLGGSSDTIPTLTRVLGEVRGAAPLLIEIKDQDGAMGTQTAGVEKAVARALCGYAGEVAVMSFNPHTVARMQDLAPHVPRGLITCAFEGGNWGMIPQKVRARLRDAPDFDAVEGAFISHEVSDLGSPVVTRLKAHGTPVICWTVRDKATEAAARKIADNITFESYTPDLPQA